MISEVFGNVFHFRSFWVTDGNEMLVVIAQLKVGLIEKLIFLDMAEHFQCAAALIKVIIIGKEIAEILFQLLPCLVGKVEDVQIIGVEGTAV